MGRNSWFRRGFACSSIDLPHSECSRRGRAGSGPRIGLTVLVLTVVARAMPAQTADSVTNVPGPQYRAGWLSRVLFGGNYRDLWTTPIRVAVLDLDTYADDLKPVRRGGFGQTNSLHFEDDDHTRYVFRSVDKDPSRRLAEELKGTFVEDIIRDQISALHPGAALVVAPLLDAANILQAQPELYVMPPHRRLKSHRDAFANVLGLMMVNPDEGRRNRPGFAGSKLITGSDRAFEEVEEDPDDRFDDREFLKARLIDVFLGDRDRHKGQWRWARFPEGDDGHVWVPIPEDRDQAFIKPTGLMNWIVRTFFARKFVRFSDEYPRIDAATWNGWDLDRYILSELTRPVWDSIATDLQVRFTDSVIDAAVRKLPPEQYALNGPELARSLKARRDHLPDMTRRYYAMVARTVDIHGRDVSERAIIDRQPDHVTVTIARKRDHDLEHPHFVRRFLAEETQEIRVYLHGGDDIATVTGPGTSVTVRVIGGHGEDELQDESSGRVYLYDGGGETDFDRGPGTRVDRRDYEAPPSSDPAHEAPPDWGQWTKPVPAASFSPDLGLYLGMGFTSYRYGFRVYPYRRRINGTVGWALTARSPTAEFSVHEREVRPRVDAGVRVRVTGLDQVRYHGFGNRTVLTMPAAAYEVRQIESQVEGGLTWQAAGPVTASVSVGGRAVTTEDDPGSLLAQEAPLGGGTVTLAEGALGLTWDTRDRPVGPTRGLQIAVEGRIGLTMDSSDFRTVQGEAAAFLTPIRGGPTVALRLGGQKVWGAFPYFEAAYLGGSTSLRGFSEQRFAGDASLFGNAEVRLPLGEARIVFPTQIGLVGLADLGRVYVAGASPGGWHNSAGGGIWLAPLDAINAVSIVVVRSGERHGIYARTGFMF